MVTPELPRTVIYARQSRDLRGHAAAVTRQVADSRKLADARNLGAVLEPIVDNDVSATSGKTRPGYLHLLELIASGQVDTVVAYHLDRLLRSLSEMEELIVLCERHDVRIMTVAGDLDLSTDMGRLVGRILASVARGEVERKGRRQKDALRQAAVEGKAPARGAFGHARYVRREGERYPVPAEQIEFERAAVQQAYVGLFAGRHITKLAADLNGGGFTTTRGGPWLRTDVRALLMNPRNAGIRYLKGERIGQGDWPAIVSEETWQAACALLKDPARTKTTGSARRWLGSGLYLCGQCGGSTMASNYKADKRRVYRCRAHLHNIRSAAPIDDYVLRVVATRLLADDAVELILGPDEGTAATGLHVEGAALRAKKAKLGVAFARDLMTEEQVYEATVDIDTRLAELDAQLATMGRRSQLYALLAADDRGATFLDADLDEQRSTIAAVCTVTVLQNSRGSASMKDTVLVDFSCRR